jgi:hypothetical protein
MSKKTFSLLHKEVQVMANNVRARRTFTNNLRVCVILVINRVIKELIALIEIKSQNKLMLLNPSLIEQLHVLTVQFLDIQKIGAGKRRRMRWLKRRGT